MTETLKKSEKKILAVYPDLYFFPRHNYVGRILFFPHLKTAKNCLASNQMKWQIYLSLLFSSSDCETECESKKTGQFEKCCETCLCLHLSRIIFSSSFLLGVFSFKFPTHEDKMKHWTIFRGEKWLEYKWGSSVFRLFFYFSYFNVISLSCTLIDEPWLFTFLTQN